ncbi:hypothetical protein [Geopseudomonas aromaticivorans]
MTTPTPSETLALNRLDTIIGHLSSRRYSQQYNEIYLAAHQLRAGWTAELDAGRSIHGAEESISELEEQITDWRKFEGMAGIPSLESRLKLTASTLLDERYDLTGYASHAAAKILLTSWLPALADGMTLPELAKDVDEVIAALSEFKAAALALDASAPGLGEARLKAANELFEASGLTSGLVRYSDWLAATPDEWSALVIVRDAFGEEQRQALRVVFEPGSALVHSTEVLSADSLDRNAAQAPAPAVSVLHGERLMAAENAFANYQFGCIVLEVNAWDTSEPEDWTRIIYVEPEDDAASEERDSERLNFHVRFKPGTGELDGAYALDMRTGAEVGSMLDQDDLDVPGEDLDLELPDDALTLVEPAGEVEDDDLPPMVFDGLDDLPDPNPKGAKKVDAPNLDDLLPPIL